MTSRKIWFNLRYPRQKMLNTLIASRISMKYFRKCTTIRQLGPIGFGIWTKPFISSSCVNHCLQRPDLRSLPILRYDLVADKYQNQFVPSKSLFILKRNHIVTFHRMGQPWMLWKMRMDLLFNTNTFTLTGSRRIPIQEFSWI